MLVDIHRQGTGSGVAAGQQENVVEFVKGPDEAQQEKHRKDSEQLRHGKVPKLLERRCPVHICRFVHIAVDALHPRKDKQEGQREISPDLEHRNHNQREGPLAKEIDRTLRDAHLDQQCIRRPGEGIKQQDPRKSHGNDRRNIGKKIKPPQDTLPLERLVQQQGRKEPEQQRANGAKHCVKQRHPEDGPEFRAVKHTSEIVEGKGVVGQDVRRTAGDRGVAVLRPFTIVEIGLPHSDRDHQLITQTAFPIAQIASKCPVLKGATRVQFKNS